MRRFDMTPLYRASVGFDQIADMLDRTLASDGSTNSYPPYNIEKVEDDGWRISIAVAGFGENDLVIEVKDRELLVIGKKAPEDTDRTYLHRGIANRAFERRFQLADHVRVTGASHVDGMLNIDLVREVPEALKPRKIEITQATPSAANVIEADKIN